MSNSQSLPPIAGFGVSDFRTLDSVEVISPGSITVVCGPNNTGKSSFLEALQLYPALVGVAQGRRTQGMRQAPFALSGNETTKIAIDIRGPAFIELLSQQKQQIRDADPAALASAAAAALGGHLWLHFKQGQRGWELDEQATLQPLSQLFRSWTQGRDGRPPGYNAFVALGGTNPGTTQAPIGWVQTVAKECLSTPEVEVIRDVRRAADKPLADEDLWQLSQANARRTDGVTRVAKWADVMERILQDVFGPEVRYEVRPELESGDFRLQLDGQDDIPLDSVGAGVREVVAISFAALETQNAGVLAIEEPENCLHPMAVRRLVQALPARAKVQLFVSTHASAVVNANPDAVVHLTRHGSATTSRQVDGAPSRYEAIRSLGYSPADLVLSPCVVWVEGPTDRLYLTRWLAADNLIEGTHYQIMFFGGALAAHVTTSADTLPEPTLAAIRNLGRHCAVVADSDRGRPYARLKPHVQRWKVELEDDPHAHLLVTWGREIENYLPLEIANQIRTSHGAARLPEANYRYAKVVSDRMVKRIGKVEFARQALELLGENTPQQARRDLRRLAKFIRAAATDGPGDAHR